MRAAAPGFEIVVKPVGPRCNLACTYCFYLDKERLYPGRTERAMVDEVLESFTRQYLEVNRSPLVTFGWQGGEPTLAGLDFFRRALGFQQRHGQGRAILNTLQTNGTLLDDAWGEFLAANGFLVGLSLDGPASLHDGRRRDRRGHPTFARVRRGLEVLRRHGVEFNTLTVVHRGNQDHALEVYRFLREAGSRFMQFIPLVEPVGPGGAHGEGLVTEATVEPLAYGRFLADIFDEWVRHDVGTCFVQNFEVALQAWNGVPPGLCWFAETCGAALALEHNGDLYACDHFVDAEHLLGNLMRRPLAELVGSPDQRDFGLAKRTTLPASCRRCDVLFACRGECPRRRVCVSPDGEPGLNYLCRGYRHFFRHVAPQMRLISARIAPRPVAFRGGGPPVGHP